MNSEVKTKNTYNEDLNWRYATKKFDSRKEISEEDLNTLLESVQLSASSYGLQPYEVIVVKDQKIREKLKAAAWNQTQVTDASYLMVFANLTHVNEAYVNTYLDNIAETRNMSREDLKGMEDMIRNTTLQLPADAQNTWAAKQAYIALGNLLSAAASQKIDACPMEGFDAAKFDEILGLKDRNLTTAVIAPIGYRSEDDQYQHLTKVRKSKSDLIEII
ncbi:NAD(P)H-dependent oxidoreductase [Christiangramia forsetii]|uniref:Nitroreductase n=2 Tax=Christiangramia forsetii TaxID=411153 RepID=A0M4S7_CHRFK|nr:NAD(P)H-dependent oxidoreductase [Christiangramia forsetii]GGG22774.1 NAD(P)H-dependent oxidoreductase [Christiangramia forsetii]CAL67622.1 nitroreductase [Christiangramia forsetii KT0803]